MRIAIWQQFGLYDYGEHWVLIGLTVAAALVGIVTFGSLTGSMLPFILQRIGFDPATGKERKKVAAEMTRTSPRQIAVSPDGRLIAAAGQGVLKVWETVLRLRVCSARSRVLNRPRRMETKAS